MYFTRKLHVAFSPSSHSDSRKRVWNYHYGGKKWNKRNEFKSGTRMWAFHFKLMPQGKA